MKLGKVLNFILTSFSYFASFCSETGLSFYNKISIGGDFGLHSSDGCSAEEHGVTRWNDGIPSEARNCPGVHKATRCVFRVRLVNGWERTSRDHVNNEYFVNAYFTCK